MVEEVVVVMNGGGDGGGDGRGDIRGDGGRVGEGDGRGDGGRVGEGDDGGDGGRVGEGDDGGDGGRVGEGDGRGDRIGDVEGDGRGGCVRAGGRVDLSLSVTLEFLSVVGPDCVKSTALTDRHVDHDSDGHVSFKDFEDVIGYGLADSRGAVGQ
ncbi:hypothetical protein QTP86_028659, partial [Hemibagrus guttatus]